MQPQIGEKYLITTTDWFYAPDGQAYTAVHGTIKAILTDEQTLGIKTNRNSTNWYVSIGNMIIAGCRIHYVVKSDKCEFVPYEGQEVHEGKVYDAQSRRSRIYNADIES